MLYEPSNTLHLDLSQCELENCPLQPQHVSCMVLVGKEWWPGGLGAGESQHSPSSEGVQAKTCTGTRRGPEMTTQHLGSQNF